MTGLMACLHAVTYVDGLCRTESFDLQVLAERIGLGTEFRRALNNPAVLATTLRSGQPDYLRDPRAAAPSPYASPTMPVLTNPSYSQPPPPLPAVNSGVPPTAQSMAPYSPAMPAPDYSKPPPPFAESTPVAPSVPPVVSQPPVTAYPDYSQPPSPTPPAGNATPTEETSDAA
jgi:hypothetical protein